MPRAIQPRTVASLVNAKQAETGVTASALTEIRALVLDRLFKLFLCCHLGQYSAVTVAFTTGAAISSDGLSAAVQAFNDVSSKTGVTARVNDGGTEIILTNASGNNITLANAASGSTSFELASFTGSNGATAATAIAAGTTAYIAGSLTLDSDKSFNVSGATAGGTTSGTSWFSAATGAGAQQTVQYADVSNVDAANRTIALVMAPCRTSPPSAPVTAPCRTASKRRSSRCRPHPRTCRPPAAGFAMLTLPQETANLTRAQILQQAGIAMLAQANALPNQVLRLLQ